MSSVARLVLAAAATTALAVGTVGCTSTPEAGACGTFKACGGDIVGTWQITDTCLTGEFLPDHCTAARVDSTGVKVEGTATFAAGPLTYSTTSTETGSVRITFPASCLESDAPTVDCKQVEKGKLDEITLAAAAGPFAAVSCVTAPTDACACTFTLKPATEMETGTYAVSDGNLVLMATGAHLPPANTQYCVSKSSLRIGLPSELSASPGLPGSATARTTIAYTKK